MECSRFFTFYVIHYFLENIVFGAYTLKRSLADFAEMRYNFLS